MCKPETADLSFRVGRDKNIPAVAYVLVFVTTGVIVKICECSHTVTTHCTHAYGYPVIEANVVRARIFSILE